MYQVKHPGTNRCLQRPREEWIIVPDAHEAIVTQAEYDRAREAVKREKLSGVPVDHIFYEKVKCPVCGHTLKRSNPRNPRFKCDTRYFTDHYNCPDCSILQADIEKSVLESVKAYAAALIDRENFKLATIRQGGVSKSEIQDKINAERRAVRVLEESVTKNITALVSGKVSQEAFLSKKEIINTAIAQKNAVLSRLSEQLETVSGGREAVEERLSVLNPLLSIEKLDREIIDLLIDKVLVYGEKRIEIVWAAGFGLQT
jgi:hypothetical protein